MRKLTPILHNARAGFAKLNPVSANILIFGQRVILAYLAAVLLFALGASDYSGTLLLVSARELCAGLLTPIMAGLCLIWGGAFLFDYLDKRQ